MEAQAARFIEAFLFALLRKICEDRADFPERSNFLVDVLDLLTGHVPPESARRILMFLQVQQLSYLPNRKTSLFGPEDKLQAFEITGSIETIAVCCSALWIEEPHLLVIAKRFTGQAGGFDDSIDRQRFHRQVSMAYSKTSVDLVL